MRLPWADSHTHRGASGHRSASSKHRPSTSSSSANASSGRLRWERSAPPPSIPVASQVCTCSNYSPPTHFSYLLFGCYLHLEVCSFSSGLTSNKLFRPVDTQGNLDIALFIRFRFVSSCFIFLFSTLSVLYRAVIWLQGERRRSPRVANTGSPRHWSHARSWRLCRHVWSDVIWAHIVTNTIANTLNSTCNVHP